MTNVRGIEHIGLTVPDIAAAETFFAEAFGATVLYRLVPKGGDDISGTDMNAVNGLPEGTDMHAATMMRLGTGPNVELFEMAPETRDTAPAMSDRGINHFSIYVEDIQAAADAARAAGGEMFDGPVDGFAQEEGAGNQMWFLRAPWGDIIELLSLPAPLSYDDGATQKRLLPLPR